MSLKGTTVKNTEVEATIDKLGNPIHSKPVGDDETILYYEVPEKDSGEDRERPKNYADTRTGGRRKMVVQTQTSGGVEFSTSKASRPVSGARPHGTPHTLSAGNVNDRIKDAEIVSADEIFEALYQRSGSDEQQNSESEE